MDIVVFDGVDELDVFGPLEVFRSASAAGVDLDCRYHTTCVAFGFCCL